MKRMANGKWQMANGSRGFTLVELLIYMGIFTVLMTVLSQLFVSIIDAQTDSQATSSVAADGRYIYSRFIYDMNRASSITTPGVLGATTPSLALVIDGDTYTYSLASESGILSLTSPDGTDTLNGYDASISAVSFQRLGNSGGKNTVQMIFTVSSRTMTGGRTETETLQTTAGLR